MGCALWRMLFGLESGEKHTDETGKLLGGAKEIHYLYGLEYF